MQQLNASEERVIAEIGSSNPPRYPRERLVEAGLTTHGQVVLQLNQTRFELRSAHIRLAAEHAAMLVIGTATEVPILTAQDDARETTIAVIEACIGVLVAYIESTQGHPRLSVIAELRGELSRGDQ